MPSAAPIIYMPLESKVRELPSRVLLARYLMRAGFRVVLGFGPTVVSGSRWFPKGLYLIKGLNSVQRQMAEIFKKQGHRVLAIDEEALGLADEWFIAKNVDPEIVPLVDQVFCQGPRQLGALKKYFAFTDAQLPLSGSSRVDFLMPPLKAVFNQEIAEIRKRYGRFVLINTNSGSVNNLWGDPRRYLGLLIEVGWYDPNNPADQALVDDHLAHDRNNLKALRDLIQVLARRRPDIRVIVRPHPSERSKIWEDIAIDLPSVTVVSNTNPHPWLEAAELVVTTGCTTGLEAALLNTPAVSLNVEADGHKFSSYFVANEINVLIRSVDEAFQRVADHWDGLIDLASMDAGKRAHSLAEHLTIAGSVPATHRIAAEIASRGTPSMDSMRDVEIHPDHNAHLKNTVKRVQWDRGAIGAEEIEKWMGQLDALLEEKLPYTLRDLSWSGFELTKADGYP